MTGEAVPYFDQSQEVNHLFETLHLISTGGGIPGNLQEVYTCPVFCGDLVWHGESNLIAFADGQLALDESTPLSEHPLGVMGSTPLDDGRFAFALALPPGAFTAPPAVRDATGTYLLTSFAETPEQVNTLPPTLSTSNSSKVLWVTDGSGALLQKGDSFFFAPTSGEFLYGITAVIGQTPHNLQWQPEIIVP